MWGFTSKVKLFGGPTSSTVGLPTLSRYLPIWVWFLWKDGNKSAGLPDRPLEWAPVRRTLRGIESRSRESRTVAAVLQMENDQALPRREISALRRCRRCRQATER